MSEQFLYQQLDTLSEFGVLDKEMPDSITQNLHPKFELRPYQVEAFARFIHCLNRDFPGKKNPLQFLFNMATGSGKTLIMAGLILYLYEHGYRNFLFFVNADNIIEKTKDNFLNPISSKYLFNKNIYLKNDQVKVTEVENFEGVNENDINIRFTTIQKLHSDLMNEKENALTFDDFKKKKIVLLSDEAHHMNVSTRAQLELDLTGNQTNAKPTWENTVENIFNANDDNLLLEFTATFDDKTPAIAEKYRNKVIYRYDLVKFRNDKYSKDIEIVRSDFSLEDRILQAILLNHYKQSVATKYKIQLKPVILFKGKTIPDSEKNKADFHKLIDSLTRNDIDRIRRSEVPIIKQAFHFFDNHNIRSERLTRDLKEYFQKKYCLAVNSKVEREKYQVEVNRLEEKNNPIRAIFAVQMLSEGWDVLNLFDIVRCYDTGSTGHNKIGKATIAEAQLIGRGARYYPFSLPPEHEDKYIRKFDEDLEHELRILEEFHYHSINDLPYITEIKKALVQQGLMDEQTVTRKLTLKKEFKETDLYKYGVIWVNKQALRDYKHVKSFADLASLSVKKKWHEHTVYEGTGGVTNMIEKNTTYITRNANSQDIPLTDIEQNIVQTAIARNPFFQFASLKRYFPQLKSMKEFRTSDNFLGGLKITFKGSFSEWQDEASEKLRACCDLLEKIEAELRRQITEYEGTKHFYKEQIRTIFMDKILKFSANNPRADENHDAERIAKAEEWFAFNGLYGTSEEKAFVQFLQTHLEDLQKTYNGVYLIRNEKHFSIYNFFDGQAFQPDFVLFLGKENGETLSYQLFIEPKGEHIEDFDRWKETFLKEIDTERKTELIIEDRSYRIIGLPFYQDKNQNEFREALDEALQSSTLCI
ncbi:MAG: DEAD/DEAH box helicase family protein [Candidatus Poribacteria bacterium]|nr:DEAD/DEAH box helicase family protein [Candidatus Poribacteria bacterium]